MIYVVEGHYLRRCEEITTIYVLKANSINEAEDKARQYDRKSPVADSTNYFVRATFNDNDLDKSIIVVYEDWRDVS